MDDPIADFYDRLAPNYHLIFPDWKKSVAYQAGVLDRLIRRYVPALSPSLLDCSCGIGTQAIGLALKGYNVHATDISPESVERAKVEATALGATLTFGVADLRRLDSQVEGAFDVVLSCDNALPHLLTDDDLRLAARSMKARLKAGGLLLASIRDYDKLVQERPSVDLPRVFDGPEGRRITFQVWDWQPDGREYTFSHFIIRQRTGEWEAICNKSRYRALLRRDLDDALSQAGLTNVEWHMPDETGYYQPIVTARA